VVPLVELQQATADISIGVVTHASAAASALHFARFVAASDRGLRVFADYYYQPVEGDVWQHSPQLVLYAGTENRHVLEPILQSFSQREGIAIATRYDDDRNLQTEIQNLSNTPAGHTFPDIYIPGHSTHFERCQPLFRRCHILSTAPLVIITPRGNSNNIHNLSDLAKPGLRIALGDPDRSTLGTLTLTLLESSGIYTDIVNNNPTIMATSSQLVSAIAAQSADAAVVLEPEARAAADRLHIVPIDSPRAEATQLFAVAEGSNHHQLAQRLLDTIGQSRAAYEHAGFRWKLVETSL
jgi:molybdate transport system substrate-binding protein